MPGLTRTQVAKRLGKSVATVRRLEGHVLFPARDGRGVHRFDEWEVERVRRNPERAKRWARSRWFEAAVREDRIGELAVVAHESPPDDHLVQVTILVGELLDRLSGMATSSLRRAGVDHELLSALVNALEGLEREAQTLSQHECHSSPKWSYQSSRLAEPGAKLHPSTRAGFGSR